MTRQLSCRSVSVSAGSGVHKVFPHNRGSEPFILRLHLGQRRRLHLRGTISFDISIVGCAMNNLPSQEDTQAQRSAATLPARSATQINRTSIRDDGTQVALHSAKDHAMKEGNHNSWSHRNSSHPLKRAEAQGEGILWRCICMFI